MNASKLWTKMIQTYEKELGPLPESEYVAYLWPILETGALGLMLLKAKIRPPPRQKPFSLAIVGTSSASKASISCCIVPNS